ncbi:hypothetical protein K493DRAFT_374215 [Basidiobolus meristosporus CBS 931.73]|uniref:Uncharacterized protein n=1 Tax=Basidiobolus meristosporus CBS 931.73 TaxID=1314790 RepID=A0A1Y1Y836_9FUNG|nr:hypothetical protein K493DRAFT_374215 [Basidiobolus meristosporus CBS 931.73]|eukprot:ORX94129.1 hypothetical protein K493DRAFT_374215 [Basidiobolus meristosporus CBS 931.73]
MKRFLTTLVVLYLSFLQVQCTANRFSVGNIENTLDSIIGKQDGSLLGNVFGQSSFASDIINPTKKCQNGILQALAKYASLRECYQLPLIFSTLDTVCSPKCFSGTVLGSQLIGESCEEELANDEESVIHTWGNEEAAKSACKLDANGVRCLSKLLTTSVAVMNLKFSSRKEASSAEYKRLLCNDCLRSLFESVDSPGDIPNLYMYKLLDAEEFFDLGVEHCDWKRPTND